MNIKSDNSDNISDVYCGKELNNLTQNLIVGGLD